MEHLACFVPGMIALGIIVDKINEKKTDDESPENELFHQKWLEISENLAQSCHLGYNQSRTGIAPDTLSFTGRGDGKASANGEKSLIRPESIESWFYLWRLTGDEKYREWAWDYAKGIEKWAKSDVGYSGLKNVNFVDENEKLGNMDGEQHTFILAETFKYLYLIFSDDDLIDLTEWVFNTEAHPLKVLKK